jgi:cbb3-type cytochrome oxidase subunit 3
MSMTELMSALSPTTLTQIATILFIAVFTTQSARALSRRMRPAHAEASALPLADDDRPGAQS